MKLFQRIFFAAVLAGLAAGLVAGALQQWRVVPLILAAEVYETAGGETVHAHDHGDEAVAPHEHDETAWAPADGVERTAYTLLATTLAALGFALVLVAVSTLAGMPITLANGALWGLGGFIAFQLAPALGLPPELPGMPAADLGARQLWWWGTALAAAAALLVLARYRNLPAVAIAAVLFLAPHVIGAPQLAAESGTSVPAGLATAFAANTLGVGAATWLILGMLIGFFDERLARSAAFSLKDAHA